MQLPIDARKAPFKPKYIVDETEILSDWFEFGSDITDGTLGLSGGNNGNLDVFVGLSREQAARIVAARQKFCAEILEILNG